MSYSIVSTGGGRIANKVLSEAYRSFVKHAPAIFDDETVNEQTGQTVYADIETASVWSRMIKGVVSKNGGHKAFISVAYDQDNKTIGFCFGIYHIASNTANLTYTGVDGEKRDNGVGRDMENKVLKAIHAESQRLGHTAVSALFVEVEESKEDQIKSRLGKGYVPALDTWVSPLLISDGKDGYNQQKMKLFVQWQNSLAPGERASITRSFIEDFYALYSGRLLKGGDPKNNKHLYPATESLAYQPKAVQDENMADMRVDAARMNSLYEADILDAFRQLAVWLAGNNLHAQAIVSGGASLLLQTHLRDEWGTKDIDLVFHEVTYRQTCENFPYSALIGTSGKAFLRTDAKNDLFTEFSNSHPTIPLDQKYWTLFAGLTTGPHKFNPPNWKDCLPCVSFLDGKGNGLEVRVASLGHIASNKDNSLSNSHAKMQQRGVDLTDTKAHRRTINDLFGICALENWEWQKQSKPLAGEVEKILRLAYLGLKKLPRPSIGID